jgi:prepilin-type N-terminal cleavage/methylation domain
MKSMAKKKNKKGFTLVELMVVVVIIGILVAIAVPMYNGVQGTAKKNAHNANVRTLQGAAALYISENGLGTPAKTALTSTDLVPKYLATWPSADPRDGTTAYTITLDGSGNITVSPAIAP